MRILVTGAAGMIGRKLAEQLVREGHIAGKEISELILFDLVQPSIELRSAVKTTVGDVTDIPTIRSLIERLPDIIFHVGAIVSGEAEADFTKGYRVNLDASRNLFEEIRRIGNGYRPRVIFASSVAVYGGPFPEIIPDDFHLVPQTSYGTQKAMVELLLSDYTRRGIFDGIGLRLPTIVVRPGAPNRALSGFFSNIIREPLAGREAILPVSIKLRHILASPRSAVGFFLQAASIDSAALGTWRNLVMPSLSVTIEEMIQGLRRVAGDRPVSLIKHQIDPKLESLYSNLPQAMNAGVARDLGFQCESEFEEIVRVYIEDELDGVVPRI